MTTLEQALGKNSTVYKDVRITKISGFYERGAVRTYDYVELDNGEILEKLLVDGSLWEVIENNFSAGTKTDLYVSPLKILLGGYRYDGRLVLDEGELIRLRLRRNDLVLFGFMFIPALISLYSLLFGAEGFGQVFTSFLFFLFFGSISYMFIHIAARKIKYRRFFLNLLEKDKREYNDKRMAELKAKQSNT